MTSTMTEQRPTTCPNWCVSHAQASDRSEVTVHHGERQTFGECTTTIDGETEPTVIYQSRVTAPDGTILDDGMMLNGVFLDMAGMEAFVSDLQNQRATTA